MGQACNQAGKVGRAPGQQAGTAGMPPGLDWGIVVKWQSQSISLV